MLKNIINYIFIYILSMLFISCEGYHDIVGVNLEEECFNCFLELSSSDLQMDENGYYHLDYINYEDEYAVQTFARLEAYIGYEYEYVGWTSDTTFEGCTWGYCEDVSIVNGASYSDEDGYAYTMLGVYPSNIGDTATVWCGYYDDFGKQWKESMRIIIDE